MKGTELDSGVPDFSKCSKEIVSMDSMTSDRCTLSGNFKQTDTQLAKQWNDSKKDDRTDWTARDIEAFSKDNQLTWHECSDMKTCMLVDRNIHDYFRHSGGVFEYNQGLRNKEDGGVFDE